MGVGIFEKLELGNVVSMQSLREGLEIAMHRRLVLGDNWCRIFDLELLFFDKGEAGEVVSMHECEKVI